MTRRDYYNEHDAFAAQWLRNLIAAGELPAGDVDERDIQDVQPSDLVGYRHCHFFAGIGGWAYAMRLAGWPDDVPLWTGSCPCQPFSTAGQGAGFADERHLWPVWFWLITQCQPRALAGEQVASVDALRWWDLVATDLEGAGYACAAVDLPAASVGAPHKRSRLFWVADAERGAAERHGHAVAGTSGRVEGAGRQRQWVRADAEHGGHAGLMADATTERRNGRGAGQAGDEPGAVEQLERLRHAGIGVADARGERCEGQPIRLRQRGPLEAGTEADGRGDAGGWVAHTRGAGSAKQQRRRVESSRFAKTSDLGATWSNCVWLPCSDGPARPVEPGTFPLAHGVPARVGRLRGYGNAIAPQVAAEVLTAWLAVTA